MPKLMTKILMLLGGKTVKKIWKLLLVISIMLVSIMPASIVSAASMDKITIPICQYYDQSQEVLKLINKERKKRGLGSLSMDKTLTKYAIRRAAELCVMVPWNSPHMRPNGTPSKSFGSVVYECCQERENGWSNPQPKDVVDSWMASPPHRAGILLSSAKSVGISFVSANDGVYGLFVLEFSNQPAKSVEKSKKIKSTNVKVESLRKYLPKKAFIIEARETYSTERKERGIYICPFIKTGESIGKFYVSPKNFSYKSGNKAIATISRDGIITPVAPGKCTFTVTYKSNPKIKKKVSYTVTEQDVENYGK